MIENKVLLISHIADPDGITPVILAKTVFKNLEVSLIEIRDIDTTLKDAITKIDNYDEIHIVDLNMSYEMALEIDKDDNLKNKIKVFDHHISGIALNEFSFITVIDERNGRKESGTSIYLEYLQSISDNPVLFKESTKGLANYVRTMDTYDFNEIEKEEAQKIDYLFGIFGREDYINHFLEFINKNDTFKFTEIENLLIDLENKKVKRYLESKEKEMMQVKINGYLIGLVYAERHRSELGNYLVNKYPTLDFAILINISRSISYRGKDKVDLNEFAKIYGGGGHKNASGSSLPDNFLKKVTKLIYNNVEFVEVEDDTDAQGLEQASS